MYWWSNRFNAMLARRYGRGGARLLEIGVGMGHLVGQLENTFETYGMDINHWAVKQSKSVVQKTQLETASAQELPFSDNSFNVVIIKHIVEHLPDPQKAIREIGRVTEPGGVLILATPNLDSMLKPWKGDKSKFSLMAFGMYLMSVFCQAQSRNCSSVRSADFRQSPDGSFFP